MHTSRPRLSTNGNLPAVAGGLSRPGARAEAIGGGTLGTLGDLAHSTQLEATFVVAAVRATGIRAVVKADLHVEEVELRAGEVIGDERQDAAQRLIDREIASLTPTR